MGWWDQAPSEAESGQRRLVRLRFARRDIGHSTSRSHADSYELRVRRGINTEGAQAGSRLIKSKE